MKRLLLAYYVVSLFITSSLFGQIHIGSPTQTGSTSGTGVSIGAPTTTQPTLVGVSSTGQPIILLWRSSYFQQAFQAFKTASSSARTSQQIHIGQSSQQPTYAAISQDVISQYKTALDLFVKVYQDPAIMSDHSTPNVTVDGTSTSNYIVVIINDMFNAFISNINQLKNSIIKLVAAGQPYQQVLDIITQAVQSYTQAAQSVAGYVQKNWDTLYTPFVQNLKGTVFSIYAFVLDTLSQQSSNTLTADNITQAGQYYTAAKALWSKDLTIPGYDSADDALTKITSAVGTIYLAGVQNAFNSMKIEPTIQTLTDVIGAQSPNRVLLTQATQYLQTLAQIYTGIDELSDLQANNSALATSLTQAGSALDSALQETTVFNQAADAANTAVPLLRAGGAAWYADHVDRIARLVTGDYYTNLAQGLMATFANTYKQRLDTLNKVITTTDTSNQDNLSDFFNALMAACGINDTTDSSPTFGYENAAAFYQGAEAAAESPFSNGPLITQAQLAQATAGAQMTDITNLATPCGNAAQLVAGALASLFGSTPSDVYSAQIAITQALPLAKQSDAAYKALKKTLGPSQATNLLPFYALFPNSSLEDFIAQYAAHVFRTLAENSTDTTVAAEYYLAAFSYNQYLTSAVQTDITNKLKNFTSIVTSAQTSLQAAQSQDSDYQNQKTPVDDTLLGAWNTALTQCLAVYTMSTVTSEPDFAKGADLYPQCLQAYLKSYALANQTDPTLAAVLNYRLYLYTTVAQSKEAAAPILKTISGLVEPLFTAAESALKTANGTGNTQAQDDASFKAIIAAYTALLTAQNNLDSLAAASATALQDQVRATPTATSSLTPLIEKSSNTSSAASAKTSYSSKLLANSKSITIPDITTSLAQTYQKYGDWALNQAINAQQDSTLLAAKTCGIPQDFNGTAMTAYSEAAQNYQAAGNTQLATQMQALSSQEQMLYGADIIGNALEAAAPDASLFSTYLGDDWPAYAQYFLNPWILPLPTDGSLSDAEATLTGDQTTNTTNLINLSAAFYLYRHLQADGAFNGFSSAGYDLLDAVGNTKDSFGDYTSYVKDAQEYKADITSWVKAGLALPDTTTVKTLLSYYTPAGKAPGLISCNLPVPAIPQTTSQPVDPTALMFYTSAFNQYSSFNGTDSRQLQYVQSKLTSIKKSITSSYVSEAYGLVQKISYMLGGTVNPQLIKLLIADKEEADTLNKYKTNFTAITQNSSNITSLDDSSDQVSMLADGISLLQDYYALAVTLVDTVAAGAEQPGAQASTSSTSSSSSENTSENTSGDVWPEARALVGYLYEQQADNIAQYLLGDPTADKFQTWLDSVSKYYALAQGSYTQANRADLAENTQLKVAQLFEKISESALQQKLYIAAIPFITAAQDQYTKLATASSQSSSSTGVNYQEKSTYMGLLELVALFEGATEFFIEWYTTRWSTPITLDSGATVTSFDALKSLQGSFAATAEETDFYNTLKSNLLDALLYYSQLQTEISNQMKNWGIASPPQQPPPSSSSSTSTSTAIPIDPAIAAYTANTLTGGQSLADYLKQGTVSPDTIRTFLEGMLLNGSSNQLDQLLASGTSSPQFAQALTLTAEWAGMIYDALAAVYIQDYVGITCPPDQVQQCVESQFLDLKEALQAEAQDIIAPAQQYVG